MAKEALITAFVFVLVVLFLELTSIVSAESIDSEIKKLTSYAAEYETGNINYVQFLIYSSAIKEKMNEILGAAGKETGGILKEDQLRAVLGEPTEDTRWVWLEGEEKEKKMDNAIPVWRKIVYDGKKIQVRLNAWPSIFSKKKIKDEGKNKEIEDLEGKLVYRLNFETEFKKPEEQLDIQGKIDNIKIFAQTFNSDPSSANAESLAKESVNAEKSFESYFKQSGGKCEDIMSSIFGTENKRRTQKLYVQEINFCEGDNFEVIARIEMCDDCESNWINIDFRFEGRGPGFNMKDEQNTMPSQDFDNTDSAAFESEIKKVIDEMKSSCENKDFNSILAAKSKLWQLNEAWNRKSNDVWKELEKIYQSQVNSMSQEERMKFDQSYGWIKLEQEKRIKAKELIKANYEKRKQFYLDLFSGYDKKESYYTQIEFEKRLLEEFKERGEEICDNNKDDNGNGAIDCTDEQCGGKICGKGKNTVQNGNETAESEVDFYCIENECKAREEIRQVVINISHVCQELPPISCSEGSRVFFSRYDNETNCPIETSCLEETESCSVNEDCTQPACGVSECVENMCKVTELAECRESECSEGDERICESDGKIVEICDNGFWKKTGDCQQTPEVRNETVVGNECFSASDCPADNICSNGLCQLLPQVNYRESEEKQEQIPEQTQSPEEYREQQQEPGQENPPKEEQQEQSIEQPSQEQSTEQPSQEPSIQEQNSQEQQQESPGVTGNIIFKSIAGFFSRLSRPFLNREGITGAAITGFDIETPQSEPPLENPPEQTTQENPPEQPIQENTPSQPIQENSPVQSPQEPSTQNQPIQENPPVQPIQENPTQNQPVQNNQFDEQRRQEEEQRRQEENKARCEKDCARPCVEKCIRQECGEELNCVVDEAQKKCEGTCVATDDCVGKCMQGGDWWKEFENKDTNKEEKGVFQVGGSCRTSQGKTEGFLWFGGWGQPFEQIQYLKNKYYSGGQADWCKYDFENLKKQRQEFEKGFNQEFVTWFFEKYLANSAENWEQSVSGIFELYWKDVDNSREMAYRMQCLGITELPPVNLINVKYDTDYGSIEFWEEIKTVKLEGMDREVQVISPYMKAWIFPSKDFIVYEMKKAMKNQEFPGSPEEKMERKNEEGPTAEEREMIKQDKKFMNQIRKVSEKYNGNLNAVIRFVDDNNVIFNLYVEVNENDIFKVKPMLPEEVPKEDVRVEIEFQKLYDLIYMQEKEMGGQRIESPPWDNKVQPIQKIKEFTQGVKMYFKVRNMLNSAEITPKAANSDVKALAKSFFSMMMKSDKNSNQETGMEESEKDTEEKDIAQSEGITGNVIFR